MILSSVITASYGISMFNFLRKPPCCFIVTVPRNIPNKMHKDFLSFTPSPIIAIWCSLDDRHSFWFQVVISLWFRCISLKISDADHLSMYLLAFSIYALGNVWSSAKYLLGFCLLRVSCVALGPLWYKPLFRYMAWKYFIADILEIFSHSRSEKWFRSIFLETLLSRWYPLQWKVLVRWSLIGLFYFVSLAWEDRDERIAKTDVWEHNAYVFSTSLMASGVRLKYTILKLFLEMVWESFPVWFLHVAVQCSQIQFPEEVFFPIVLLISFVLDELTIDDRFILDSQFCSMDLCISFMPISYYSDDSRFLV